MGDNDLLAKLNIRIAELEAELAKYASRYGMTDEARRLFSQNNHDAGNKH